MENGSDLPNRDVAADLAGEERKEHETVRASESANQSRGSQFSEIEVGGLKQEIFELRARVNELEDDKKFLMDQLKGQLQLQNMLAKTLPESPQQASENTETNLSAPHEPRESSRGIKSVKAKSDGQVVNQTGRDERSPHHEPSVNQRKAQLKSKEATKRLHDPNFHTKIFEKAAKPARINPPVTRKLGYYFKFQSVRMGMLGTVAVLCLLAILFNLLGDKEADVVPRKAELGSVGEGFDPEKVPALIFESWQCIDDPSLNMLARYSNVKKRIQIADQLLAYQQDPEARRFGIQSKLQALVRQALLNLQFDVSNAQNSFVLTETVEANLNSTDATIAKSARGAEALHSILEFLDEFRSKNPDAVSQQQRANLITNFTTAQEFSSDDLSSAQSLFEIANLMNDANAYRVPELLVLCHKHFSKSKTDLIRTMAAEAKTKYWDLQLPLTEIADAVESQVDSKLDELSSQIDVILALPNISADQLERVANSVAGVIQTGRIEEARELIMKALERIGSSNEMKSVRDQLELMMSQADQVGTAFSLDGLLKLDGTSVAMMPDTAAQLVLFVNTASYIECTDRLNKLGEAILMFQTETEYNVSIAIVVQDYGVDSELIERLEQLQHLRERLGIWKIDVSSDSGQEFLQRFPISRFPFLIIVNGKSELIAIDPPEHFVESIVFNVLRDESPTIPQLGGE